MLLVGCVSFVVWCRWAFAKVTKGSVGFFHPFADGGGGGERVLWTAVKYIQNQYPHVDIVIYCGGDLSAESLAVDASQRFNISVAPTFRTIGLKYRDLLRPERYPRLTMVLQALGSVRLAVECLKKHVPEVWIDTTGWAFPYPMVRLAGSKIVAYVHYPTISTDMLSRVRQRHSQYNNNDEISSSAIKSYLKLVYYQIFSIVYGLVGSCSNVVMVNSTWTKRHIDQLWWYINHASVVYPPCDTKDLQSLPLDKKLKRIYVISVAQFRPEKNHELQLKAFAAAREFAMQSQNFALADAILSSRLQLVGSCRGPDDERRLNSLKELARKLDLGTDEVEFKVNVSFDELRRLLGDAAVGLHTMEDEHFGISVVEYMAAGVIPIAHASGGPKEDIVVPASGTENDNSGRRTGYLCRTLSEYKDALIEAIGMSQVERLDIAAAGRRRAAFFSEQNFASDFLNEILDVMPAVSDNPSSMVHSD